MDEPKPEKRAEGRPEKRPATEPTRLEEARRMIEEYAADLHELMKKLREKMN